MQRDNLELLNFTKSQIFETQRYNIVENIILYNLKHLKLFEIWNSKKQLAKQMTFWSIWKKENSAYNRSFQRNVSYEKSRILLKTKMKYFVIARINQSYFVIKLN